MFLRTCILRAAASPPPPVSPFDVLGLPPYANRRQIRGAYMKLAKKYHPDVNPDGAEKFVEVKDAYERALRGEGRATTETTENTTETRYHQDPPTGQTKHRTQRSYEEAVRDARRSEGVSETMSRMPPWVQRWLRRELVTARHLMHFTAIFILFPAFCMLYAMLTDILLGVTIWGVHHRSPAFRMYAFIHSKVSPKEKEEQEREEHFEDLLFGLEMEETADNIRLETSLQEEIYKRHPELRPVEAKNKQGSAGEGSFQEAPLRPSNPNALGDY